MRHLPKHTLPSRELSDSSATQFRQLLNGRVVDRVYSTPAEFIAFNFGSAALARGKRVSVSRRDGNVAGKRSLFPALSEMKRLDESLSEQKCSGEHYLRERTVPLL